MSNDADDRDDRSAVLKAADYLVAGFLLLLFFGAPLAIAIGGFIGFGLSGRTGPLAAACICVPWLAANVAAAIHLWRGGSVLGDYSYGDRGLDW